MACDYIANASYDLSQKEAVSLHHFRKVREIFSKENIDINRFSEDVQSELKAFDHIIGVRATKLNCYDAIIFNFKENIMIIQLDLISMLNAGEIDKNIEDFLRTLNTLISNKLGNNFKIDKKTNAINLYPCIENFYKNIEGTITRLSFTTSKGVHNETLKKALQLISEKPIIISEERRKKVEIFIRIE